MKKRSIQLLVAMVLIVGGISLCIFFVTSGHRYNPKNDKLTQQYGTELETALNYYFSVIRSDEAYQNPEEECPKVTVEKEEDICLSSHMNSSSMGDSSAVQKIRVVTYSSECSIAIAVYTTAGSIYSQVFLLKRDEGNWKVADGASGYTTDRFGEMTGLINMADPPIPFTCKE